MIRAHLATFPDRRRLLRQVTESILPQVDQLFVVLNDYQAIPGFLHRDPKVVAVIPDRDVKDAGKFWFAPDPADIVFTIDDDIGYPPDYVSRTLGLIAPMGFEGRVYGYQGNAYAHPDGQGNVAAQRWHNYLFKQELTEVRGASVIGTGTLCARGDALPPLAVIEPLAGAVDFAYGAWLQQQGIMPWLLPRVAEWLPNILPNNLRKSSLFATVTRAQNPEHMTKLRSFAFGWPHANIPFDDYDTNAH